MFLIAMAAKLMPTATADDGSLPTPTQYKNGTIRYRGVNLSGSEFGNKFYSDLVPTLPADMLPLAQAGANVARFPIKWEFVQPTPMQALDPTYMNDILPPI